jgi:glycosyltransferase involved in cell wall biosynthesis
VGVVFDYPQEGWASMDLVAEMVLAGLKGSARLCPPYRRRFERLNRRGRNPDRLLNRMWDYPRYARRIRGDFDCFHLVDHSYSQVVHALPAERTGVHCQDLDTFGCLQDPAHHPRPKWFRAMTRRILRGLQKAQVVFYSTQAVRWQIEGHGLIDPARQVWAPLGPAAEFVPHPQGYDQERDFDPSWAASLRSKYLLHVGSCIARKRIDVLLEVFAAVRQAQPQVQLVQVGGQWTADQAARIERLGLGNDVLQLRGLTRHHIAALYRQAAVVLQPSEAEGFGLPVIEALACGAAVVASDIPVLREVGGEAALYCAVGAVDAWAQCVTELLAQPQTAPAPAVRAAQARRFSWENHCRILAQAYGKLV